MFETDENTNHFSLLVTGNGFDIALNLPTKYEDFLKMLKTAKNITDIGEFIDSNKGRISNEADCLSFINVFKSIENENYFLRYFLAYKYVLEKWCDVEQEIKNIVLSFDAFLFNVSKASLTHSKAYIGSLENVKTLNIFHPEFVRQWHGFVFRTDDDYHTGTIVDADYIGNFTAYTQKNRFEEIRKEIVDALYKDLNDFKLLFSLYIKCFAVCSHLTLPKSLSVDCIITYNYTKSTELCVDHIDKPFYIHGQGTNIVLGICSDSSFHDHRFNRFTKLSQRTNIPNMDINDYLGEGSFIGYIGFSFNENDKETIAEFFKQDDIIHIIYYLNESAKNDIVENLMSIITFEKYNRLFNSHKIRYELSSKIFN